MTVHHLGRHRAKKELDELRADVHRAMLGKLDEYCDLLTQARSGLANATTKEEVREVYALLRTVRDGLPGVTSAVRTWKV